jgi:DNA-binding MarR family transcriptional regulator
MEEESQNRINNFILWGLFFTSQSAVGRLRTLELASIGVTPEQSGVLQLLAGNKGKSSIAEMADAWLRQKNSVSTLINRMSKQGLVEKIKIPKQKDLEIEITRKGRELYYKINNTSKVFDMAFADLSREDKKRFAHYLELVLARSRKILDEKDPR